MSIRVDDALWKAPREINPQDNEFWNRILQPAAMVNVSRSLGTERAWSKGAPIGL